MSNIEQPSAETDFRPAETLSIDDGYAMAYVTSFKGLIAIADCNNPMGLNIAFNVPNARALRDWLNKVLP